MKRPGRPACSVESRPLFTLDVFFANHGAPGPHLRRQEAPQAVAAADIELDLQRFGQLPVDRRGTQRVRPRLAQTLADPFLHARLPPTSPPPPRLATPVA